MSRPRDLTFEILWLDTWSADSSPRISEIEEVKRHDLTAAITAATNLLKKRAAHGFVVRRKADSQTEKGAEV